MEKKAKLLGFEREVKLASVLTNKLHVRTIITDESSGMSISNKEEGWNLTKIKRYMFAMYIKTKRKVKAKQ